MSQEPLKNLNILLACMPKSGSTYLSHIISRLPQMRRESLVPGYQRREHEIDEALIVECKNRTAYLRRLQNQDMLKTKARPLGWIAQHHTRYSETTGNLFAKHNVRPVVLVRNIFDIVPSLHDHLVKSSQFMSMAYVEEGHAYDDETFQEFIAEMAIPWYFNFYVSWVIHAEAPIVTYEQLISDPVTLISELFQRWNVPIGEEAIAKAVERAAKGNTRKNKGVAGRGAQLPEAVKDKIRGYTKYYPAVDFAPIGL